MTTATALVSGSCTGAGFLLGCVVGGAAAGGVAFGGVAFGGVVLSSTVPCTRAAICAGATPLAQVPDEPEFTMMTVHSAGMATTPAVKSGAVKALTALDFSALNAAWLADVWTDADAPAGSEPV